MQPSERYPLRATEQTNDLLDVDSRISSTWHLRATISQPRVKVSFSNTRGIHECDAIFIHFNLPTLRQKKISDVKIGPVGDTLNERYTNYKYP